MDKALAKKLDDFRQRVCTSAEDVIYSKFPSKILELQELLETSEIFASPSYLQDASASTDSSVYPPPVPAFDIGEQSETKKRKRLENGSATPSSDFVQISSSDQEGRFFGRIGSNHRLSEVMNILRLQCESLVENCDKVKLWVNLTMPKIEDGDNFGVQVQEEALADVHRAQDAAHNMRDSIRAHHIARGKLCSKLLKYPNIEDYKIALREHDNKQFYMVRQHLNELKNVYAVLTDILHKNIAKIRAPKGNNSAALY